MTEDEIDLAIQALQEFKKSKNGNTTMIELKSGSWEFSIQNGVSNCIDDSLSPRVKYGVVRTTRTHANRAAIRMLRTNRLSALAAQLSGERDFVRASENFYVYYSSSSMLWVSGMTVDAYAPERVYMTSDMAETIANILNKTEFALEGDKKV